MPTEFITPAQAFHSYGTGTDIINVCIKQKFVGITAYRDFQLLKYKWCWKENSFFLPSFENDA